MKIKIKTLGTAKKRIVNCIICKKKLLTYTKTHSVPHSSGIKNRSFTYSDSSHGVLFIDNKKEPGVWFCNSCWKQIISKVKFQD